MLAQPSIKSFEKELAKTIELWQCRSHMSKDLSLASRIRALKASAGFVVKTERERQAVCRIAKTLKDAGVIDFDVITKQDEKGFKVGAI